MKTPFLAGSIGCLLLLAAIPAHAGGHPPSVRSNAMPTRTVQFIRRTINVGLADMSLSHRLQPSLKRLLPCGTEAQRQSYRKLSEANRYDPPASASHSDPARKRMAAGDAAAYVSSRRVAPTLASACRLRPHPRRAPLCQGVPLHDVHDPLAMPSTLLGRTGSR